MFAFLTYELILTMKTFERFSKAFQFLYFLKKFLKKLTFFILNVKFCLKGFFIFITKASIEMFSHSNNTKISLRDVNEEKTTQNQLNFRQYIKNSWEKAFFHL